MWEPVWYTGYRGRIDIEMLGPADGRLVASHGFTAHWDGISWIKTPTLPDADLASVSMLNSNDGWAVGEDGTK